MIIRNILGKDLKNFQKVYLRDTKNVLKPENNYKYVKSNGGICNDFYGEQVFTSGTVVKREVINEAKSPVIMIKKSIKKLSGDVTCRIQEFEKNSLKLLNDTIQKNGKVLKQYT